MKTYNYKFNLKILNFCLRLFDTHMYNIKYMLFLVNNNVRINPTHFFIFFHSNLVLSMVEGGYVEKEDSNIYSFYIESNLLL